MKRELTFPYAFFSVLPGRSKKSLSTGAIVGIVIAAFAAAAVLSSLVTLIILRRRTRQFSKKRTGKPLGSTLYGLNLLDDSSLFQIQ